MQTVWICTLVSVLIVSTNPVKSAMEESTVIKVRINVLNLTNLYLLFLFLSYLNSLVVLNF